MRLDKRFCLRFDQMDYDNRKMEVKDFDDLKIGVKGLVDSGITTIPRFFLQPPEILADPKTCQESVQLPIIDLFGLNSPRRPEITDHVTKAAREWGFFQVVNHNIPLSVMEATISAIRSFHEQPQERKKWHYNRKRPVTYVANNDLLLSKAASWRDTLFVKLSHEEPEVDQIPEICRKEVVEWSEHATRLAEMVMELLSEGLGLEGSKLKETKCLSKWILAGQFYPCCPQPELTVGLPSHTDKGALTVVLQDHMGGLQVKKGEEWVPVKPIPGALVINFGDFLQVLSNDEYKSAEHRVLANPSREPRISVVVFFSPSEDNTGEYGPMKELLSPTKPPRYRNFTLVEMNAIFSSKELGDISLPREFQL